MPVHRPMRVLFVLSMLAILAAPSAAAGADTDNDAGRVDLPRYPSIRPDGSHITFSWRGDLWKAPIAGGRAVRLTVHPQDDLRSAWSADGTRIAFTSDRNGYANIYLMNADGTNVRRLTDVDRSCSSLAFGVDEAGGEVVTFHATLEGDVYRDYRPYMVSTRGGDVRRVHDAFGSEPVVSADGTRVVFTRAGYYDRWERRHYRGPDNADVWLFDRRDDSFRRLTEHRGHDGLTTWSGPNTLLYMSDRELDCVNLYRMSAADGEESAVRLTSFREHPVHGFDVTADGSLAVLAAWNTLYTLDLTDPDAEPQPLHLEAIEDERDNYELKNIGREVSEAALSPDGQVMAMIAYGEVYVRNIEDGSPTRRVTNSHAREKNPAWSPDGRKLYFTSDRDGTESIYAATVKRTRGEIKDAFEEAMGLKKDEKTKPEKEEPAAEAEADGDGGGSESSSDAAPATDDPVSGVWSGSAEIPEEAAVSYTLTLKLHDDNSVSGSLDAGPYSGPVTGTWDPANKTLEFSVAAGGPQVVITFRLTIENGTARGTATADDTVVEVTATRVSAPDEDEDAGSDSDKPKKEKEDKELPPELQPDRWHDAMTFDIEPVVQRNVNDRNPSPSPDGTMLAFRGTRGDIHIMDLESREIRTLVTGWDPGTHWRWSPDSRYIAYAQSNLNFNQDIFIVPADGTGGSASSGGSAGSGGPVNITRHPDNESSPRWSADGKILSFISERINEEYDVWAVYLDKDLEALTPQELKEYYEEAGKAAKKRKPLKVRHPAPAAGKEDTKKDDEKEAGAEDESPLIVERDALDLDDAYLRLRRITGISGNETGLEMTPSGEHLIFNARGDAPGLYSIKWDGSGQKRIAGNASVQHVSLTGGKVILVTGGRAATIKPTGGMETVSIGDRIRIDLEKQSSQKFREAARRLGEEYYHPTMNGLDWPALTEEYHALVLGAHTADEFNWVANRFVGELNGSHLGISARGESPSNRESYGRLGIDARRVDDGYEVTDIIPEGPAAKGPMALKVGDVITAVDFEPVGADDTIRSMLKGRVGEETVISITRHTDEGETLDLDVLLTPTSYYGERSLKYRAWRLENARLVEEWSDGRLGYIHIRGMNQSSLDVFERDLFAAADGKDGLIIDVRNNGGGWTADRLLASIMVQEHAFTIPRGADWSNRGHYPQDRLFIQRYTLPINMLCNDKSFSNAEIVSHAFKTLGRGTLVGQQTHGSVISTGGFRLIDGTFVRLPFRGWFVTPTQGNGFTEPVNMELHGAMPDLRIPQRPEAEARGDDEQLRAAVYDLLGRLD
ncbi:MAG: S41 family peptidase [Planctomycetota bacterium]|nr:S41 family peptidase [Planctomycetota bacterium]